MAWLNIMILREKAHLVLVGLKTSALKTMAIVQMALTREIKLTTAAQMLWNKVLLTNPITAVIAVVAGLTAAIVTLSKETSTAEQAQRDYNDAVTDANKQTAEEEASIIRLVSAIQSNTSAESDRKAALEELNGKLMSQHLGNITEEAVRTGQATRQIQSYIDMMKKKIVIDGLQKKLAESIAKQAEAEDLLGEGDNDNRGYWKRFWDRLNPFAGGKTQKLNFVAEHKDLLLQNIERENSISRNSWPRLMSWSPSTSKSMIRSLGETMATMARAMMVPSLSSREQPVLIKLQIRSARLVSRQRGQLQPRNASDRLKPSASRSRQPIASRLKPTS